MFSGFLLMRIWENGGMKNYPPFRARAEKGSLETHTNKNHPMRDRVIFVVVAPKCKSISASRRSWMKWRTTKILSLHSLFCGDGGNSPPPSLATFLGCARNRLAPPSESGFPKTQSSLRFENTLQFPPQSCKQKKNIPHEAGHFSFVEMVGSGHK